MIPEARLRAIERNQDFTVTGQAPPIRRLSSRLRAPIRRLSSRLRAPPQMSLRNRLRPRLLPLLSQVVAVSTKARATKRWSFHLRAGAGQAPVRLLLLLPEPHCSDQRLNHRCSGRRRRRWSGRAPPLPPAPRPRPPACDRLICTVQSQLGLSNCRPKLGRIAGVRRRCRPTDQPRHVVGETGEADQGRHHSFQQDQARRPSRKKPVILEGGLERGLDRRVLL